METAVGAAGAQNTRVLRSSSELPRRWVRTHTEYSERVDEAVEENTGSRDIAATV
jgi:hypothetical protein